MQETGGTLDSVGYVLVKAPNSITVMNQLTILHWLILASVFGGIVYFIYKRKYNSKDSTEYLKFIRDEVTKE